MVSEGANGSSRSILTLTSLAHFVNDGTTFFVPVLAALLSPLRGFSPLEVTVVFVVFYVASASLGLVIGWWADRHGRPAGLLGLGIGLLGVGLFGFYVVLAGLAGPLEFPVALLAGMTTGLATSFYHPLGASLLQHAFPPGTRGTAMGINGAAGSAGRTLYPFAFFALTLVVVTTDSILALVAVCLASALAVVVGLRSVAAAERSNVPPGPPARARESVTAGIVALAGVSFVRSIATQGVAVWMPTYLTPVRGVPASGYLGLAVTVMYVGGILGQPFFGLLTGRVDQRLLIGASSAGAALCTFGYLFTGGIPAQFLLFMIGFFTFSAFPLLMTLSAEYVPRGSSSLANALVFGLGSGGGGTVGLFLVGSIAAGGYGRLPLGLEAMAGLGLVAAVLVVLLPRGSRTTLPARLFT